MDLAAVCDTFVYSKNIYFWVNFSWSDVRLTSLIHYRKKIEFILDPILYNNCTLEKG